MFKDKTKTMFYNAKILVTLKPEVKDAKAQVLEQVIKRKEFASETVCNVGKYYRIKIEAKNAIEAKYTFDKIANEILANLVIEQYEILSLEEVDESLKSRDYCLSCN